MAHAHSVYDTDVSFKIDMKTKAIKKGSSMRTKLVQGDHNSEKFTFTLNSRYVEGHDMTLCNRVELHYINTDIETRCRTSKNFAVLDDLTVDLDTDDVTCSWMVTRGATKYAGLLQFLLTFKCIDDSGEEVYSWSTTWFTGMQVLPGGDNSDYVLEEFNDAFEQLRREVLDAAEKTSEEIKAAVREELAENPPMAGATAAEAAQIEQNKQNIATLDRTKLAASELPNAVNEALAQAKASGEFDGEPGTDGVSATHKWSGTVLTVTSASGTSSADLKGEPGADGKDYVLTEADRQEIAQEAAGLVEVPDVDIPTTLPNPNALTFTGAATGTYDGTKPLTVNIPEGGTGAVSSVNGKTGVVALTAADVNALWMNTTSYATNANNVTTTQLTKTNISTANLPNEITNANERWGVLMFVAENDGLGNGTQMYWPINGNCAGRMFVRGHANGTWSAWKKVAYTDEITGGGGSSIELDTTLSVAGKAADAKAVGDALANVGNPTDEQVETAVNAWLDENGVSTGGGGGGWRKVTEYVWDVNKEYQPLTLDYATGEMTFDETPPFNKACWAVPNETNVHNTLYHSLYSKIPKEFLDAGKVAVFSQGTNGVLYDNKTNLAVGGVNQNVDVSAFRFEHSNSNVVFDGLNAKRLLIKMSFTGGNINTNNGLWNFIPVFSDGSQASNLVSVGVVSARIMTGCLEQEMYIADGKFYCMQRIIGKMVKGRTNGNQGDTPISGFNTAVDIRATKDTTITKIQYMFGNGNYFPANGTLVEVFEFAE